MLAQHLWPTPGEKQLRYLHIRSYLNPKGVQPYKGMHAYINGFVM